MLSIVKDCGFPAGQISKGSLQTETEETMFSSINTLEEITFEEEEEEEEEGGEEDDDVCEDEPIFSPLQKPYSMSFPSIPKAHSMEHE
jgi:hypothetical protein